MDSHPAAPAAPRLVALDHLRALMMWLGIVLHVSVNYMERPSVLPWMDPSRWRGADSLVGFIHAFRMPVFFVLAGFFVALLLRSRGPRGLARHRLQRLGLPFAVFYVPVFALCGLAGLAFLHRIVHGTWGLDPSLFTGSPTIPNDGLSTGHMWFLWMLLWFSLATALAAHLGAGRWLQGTARLLQRLGLAWWGFAVLALPMVAAGLPYPQGLLYPGGSFLPPWNEWVHNGLFYVFGIALFHRQANLFAHYTAHWRRYAWAGLFAFFIAGGLIDRNGPAVWIAFTYNACSWLWSFAFIGLALKVMGKPDPRAAWLADSAYWVYLVHMPVTIFFGAVMVGAGLHPVLKMLVGIAGTTLVCLATYHLFVRSSWIGQLLNGKRHPRLPHPAGAAAAQ